MFVTSLQRYFNLRQSLIFCIAKQISVFLPYFQYCFRRFWNNNLIEDNQSMKEKSKGSQYKCAQVFGYKGGSQKIHEEDLISVLKFDSEGRHLALGDKAGRVIVFKNDNSKKKEEKFNYYTEFQAYNRQFDPLNSSDVDEEILGISWLRNQGSYQKIITMNSKSIKLWKIFEKAEKKMIRSANKDLALPKFQNLENCVNASVQKSFVSSHQEDLIAMDQSRNEQFLLSTDTVKTLMWDMEKSSTPFLVADLLKGRKIQEVKQNINCLQAHPTCDSLFAYGTNRGSIVLSDTRISQSSQPLTLKMESDKEKSNFFSQMISSYSSLVFLNNNQKQIAARDFLSIKIWDLTKSNKPVATIPVQEALKSKLCEIFENDSIFDKFTMSASKDSNTLLTGNYNNCFHAIDTSDSSNTQYEINYKKQTVSRPIVAGKATNLPKMDYARKVIASDFHPKANLMAVASLNCFLIYSM